MKVKDLILKLQSVDPDLEVLIPNGDIGGQYVSIDAHDVMSEDVRMTEWADDIFERTGQNYPRAQKAVIIG